MFVTLIYGLSLVHSTCHSSFEIGRTHARDPKLGRDMVKQRWLPREQPSTIGAMIAGKSGVVGEGWQAGKNAEGWGKVESQVFFFLIEVQVSAHTELMWILSTVASMGYLSRMTQWKVCCCFLSLSYCDKTSTCLFVLATNLLSRVNYSCQRT